MLFSSSVVVGDKLLGVGVVFVAADECRRCCVVEVLSWKLVVLSSHSSSKCVLTSLRWNIGSQCVFRALAMVVGVVESSSLSLRIAPML